MIYNVTHYLFKVPKEKYETIIIHSQILYRVGYVDLRPDGQCVSSRHEHQPGG